MVLESGAGVWGVIALNWDRAQEKVTTKDTPTFELKFTGSRIVFTLIFETSRGFNCDVCH